MRKGSGLERRKPRTDYAMNQDEYDLFALELTKKRLETVIGLLGDDNEVLKRSQKFIDKWVQIKERTQVSDSPVVHEEADIDLTHLFEDHSKDIRLMDELVSRVEQQDFNTRLRELPEDDSDKLDELLRDHLDRYGYSRRNLAPRICLALWHKFGKDEKIRPYVEETFSDMKELVDLLKHGLTPQEASEITNWIGVDR